MGQVLDDHARFSIRYVLQLERRAAVSERPNPRRRSAVLVDHDAAIIRAGDTGPVEVELVGVRTTSSVEAGNGRRGGEGHWHEARSLN
jgi:hypothetical protein